MLSKLKISKLLTTQNINKSSLKQLLSLIHRPQVSTKLYFEDSADCKKMKKRFVFNSQIDLHFTNFSIKKPSAILRSSKTTSFYEVKNKWMYILLYISILLWIVINKYIVIKILSTVQNFHILQSIEFLTKNYVFKSFKKGKNFKISIEIL